jgi:hypothetical protein
MLRQFIFICLSMGDMLPTCFVNFGEKRDSIMREFRVTRFSLITTKEERAR